MEKLLKWNAEFAKNIWLELSPQRLITAPVIIGLVMLAIIAPGHNVMSVLHYVSKAGFIFIGMVWGIKSAADSVLDEYNEKTWDWQRMNALGAWKLTFGKLFGSTIYNWYGAMICWAIYVGTVLSADDPVGELKTAFTFIIAAIAMQGLMILLSLQVIRRADGKTRIKNTQIFILGLVFIYFLVNILTAGALTSEGGRFTTWYGLTSNSQNISLINSVFFCAWVIVGVYRSLRAELQYSDPPTYWLAFLLSTFVFEYGYIAAIPNLNAGAGLAIILIFCLVQVIGLLYFMMLSEAKSIVNFRVLLQDWREKNYKSFFENCPLWIITLPVFFIIGILAVVFFHFLQGEGLLAYPFFKNSLHLDEGTFSTGSALIMLVSITCFILRDLAVILLISFSSRVRRDTGTILLYLALMYFLLPWLTKNFNTNGAFYPQAGAPVWSVFFPLLQALLVIYPLFLRWGQLNRQIENE